jgi:hypothetical protein
VRYFRYALPGLALFFLGCSPKPQTILTGNTAYEMHTSIMLVSAELPPVQRDEFNQAIETIILGTTDRSLEVDGNRMTRQAIQSLKGRSVRQVIETAKLLRSASSSRAM